MEDQITAEIQAHYRRVAEEAQRPETFGGCCPGPGTASLECPACGPAQTGGLPAAAVRSSRGIGDPLVFAALRPGERVLDLGCGGGLDVLRASLQVGPSGWVYGLDLTPEMVALARQNVQERGATNVTILQGDLLAIPLPAASVDVVISNCVLNLVPDKVQALGEAWRALRPGGRLALVDVVIDPDFAGLPLTEETIRATLGWAGCLGGALTTAQYRTALTTVGFADLHLRILRRFTLDDLAPPVLRPLARLAPTALRDLANRVTSTAILARRPAV